MTRASQDTLQKVCSGPGEVLNCIRPRARETGPKLKDPGALGRPEHIAESFDTTDSSMMRSGFVKYIIESRG